MCGSGGCFNSVVCKMFNCDLKDSAWCLGGRRNRMFMSVLVVRCGELEVNGVVENVLCDGSAS